MDLISSIRWLGNILSVLTLVLGFLLFYSDNKEWKGSLLAALLSAALVYGSFMMIRWLVQVFKK
jgi:hypothetical protein